MDSIWLGICNYNERYSLYQDEIIVSGINNLDSIAESRVADLYGAPSLDECSENVTISFYHKAECKSADDVRSFFVDAFIEYMNKYKEKEYVESKEHYFVELIANEFPNIQEMSRLIDRMNEKCLPSAY